MEDMTYVMSTQCQASGLSVTESETYRFGSHLIHKMLEWL